jgi:hypothetical protein
VSPPSAARSQIPSEQPTPTTGVDFSGVDEFWRLVDVLSKEREPSDSQWHTLLTTPGYRLAQLAIGNVTREDLELAFRPSRRAQFDSLTELSNDRASRLKHLTRAASLRSRLDAFRDSLGRVDVMRDALATAAKLLPPGATKTGDPPLVAFALFRSDGYAIRGAVLVDLLRAYESDLMLFLAHEFHHTYLSRVSRPFVPSAAGHAALRAALEQLRSEGIADLIDKPYPLSSSIPERAAYVTRYNEEYARTPAVLHELDSLLAIAAKDSGQIQAVGQRARLLLWNSGHAHGAYMARQVLRVFGTDSLFAGVLNPAAFLRTFACSEEALGRPKAWSSEAMQLIDVLEARYWR